MRGLLPFGKPSGVIPMRGLLLDSKLSRVVHRPILGLKKAGAREAFRLCEYLLRSFRSD